MSQSTAKPHSLEADEGRKVRVEGEEGKQELAVTDRQLKLLESIDNKLGEILLLMKANL